MVNQNDLVIVRARPADLAPFTILALLYFFPASLPYLFSDVSSFAFGMVISLVAAWLIYGMGWGGVRAQGAVVTDVALAVMVGLFVALHLVVSSQLTDVNFGRAVSSLFILLFMIVSASLVSDIIFSTENRIMAITMNMIGFMFLGIAALSIAGIGPAMVSYGEKPIFPYTEPSFFAFTFAPVLIYLVVTSNLIVRMAWLIVALAIASIMANLTLVVVCVLAAAIALPIPVMAVSAFVISSLIEFVNIGYFTSRINFGGDTSSMTNISTLVYIQGWQLLEESLRKTWGWGLGFQQLGFGYTNVPASVRLNQLLGFDLNLTDGGFIVAKLGSEFGIFGLIVAGLLILRGAKSIWFLRRLGRGKGASAAELLAHATLAASLVEMLVRGANYFTGSLVMVLAAWFYMARTRKREAARPA